VRAQDPKTLTAYEILRVHPSAPIDLISTCYWALTRQLHDRADQTDATGADLHTLTRAYEIISDSAKRARYNIAIGYADDSLLTRPLPRKRFFLARWREGNTWRVDPYEVLGLHPDAPQSCIPEAHRQMRNTYLRIPQGRRRNTLLAMLEDAYAIIGDPVRRSEYTPVRHSDREIIAPPDTQPTEEHLAGEELTSRPQEPPTGGERSTEPAQSADQESVRSSALNRVAIFGVAFSRVVAQAARRLWRLVVAAAGLAGRATVSALTTLRNFMRQRRDDKGQDDKSQIEGVSETSDDLSPDDVFLGRLASTVGDSDTPHNADDQVNQVNDQNRSEIRK